MSNLESEEKLKNILMNFDDYDGTQLYRNNIIKGDQLILSQYNFKSDYECCVICYNINNKKSNGYTHLKDNGNQVIQLARDCMETFNDDFISQAKHTILPQFEKQAFFAKEYGEEERKGRRYFSSQPKLAEQLARMGNTFIQLILECIWVWSKWFPIDPETYQISAYRITLEKLIQQKIKFPKIMYFSVEEIVQYLPEQMTPIKMLQELRTVVASDLKKTNNEGSSVKQIGSKLGCQLKSELIRVDKGDIFYSDIMLRWYKANKLPEKNENLQNCQDEPVVVDNKLQESLVPNARANEPVTKVVASQIISQQNDLLRIQVKQLQNDLLKGLNEKQTLNSELSKKDQEVLLLKQQKEILKEKIDNYEMKIQQISQQVNFQVQGMNRIIANSKQTQSVFQQRDVEAQFKYE